MPDATYVSIARSFCDVTKDPSTSFSRRFAGRTGKTWDDLVPATAAGAPRSAVVVLAPSGLGKSSELEQRAQVLRSAGVSTFFMRAGDIATFGVAGAVSDTAALLTWKDTSSRGVFFIDAVDEARAEGHDLARVLQRFALDLDPATKSVQLVLSSRNDLWSNDSIRHIVRILALPSEGPPVSIVRLEPLSLDDLRLYASARGISDSEALVRAFSNEELDDLFDLRPPDAQVLVEYWKQHGAFGSWSDMLEAFVEANVRNENRRHAAQQQFTLEEARNGLARLGAATVLGRRSLISLPGRSHDSEVNAERLFADRRPAATSQLLGMGLFTQKGVDAVQLPQGGVTHFLAARWLGERARRGMDPRALEDALFISPFDAKRTLIPPSRAPVVGWVAGTVPALRKRLLRDLPYVLLFEGDPSKLSRGECIEALRAVLADIEAGRNDPSPTMGTLRQVAKHEIAEAVARLLEEFRGVRRAERLLLRLAEVGRYAAVVAPALLLAMAPDVQQGVGDIAIRVVAAVGSLEQRTQLLQLADHHDEWIRLAVVQALTPDILNGEALVDLVRGITGDNAAYILGTALARASLADVDAILVALAPSLTVTTVTESTEAHVELVAQLTATRLNRGGEDIPSWMPELLLNLASHFSGPYHIPTHIREALEKALIERTALRRAVWQARIDRSAGTEGGISLMTPQLGHAQPEDVQWFWSLRESAADDKLRRDLEWPLYAALRRMSRADRTRVGERGDAPLSLKAFIDVAETQGELSAAAQRKSDAKTAVDEAETRAKNIAALLPQRQKIEAGSHGNALVWAWQHLESAAGQRSRLGTGRLIEAVGRDLAEAFILGFQRWWRQHEPALPEPGNNSVSLLNLAGLTGLSLEVEHGLDLSTLTDAEVQRATRYALYELNGFPLWFDSLRAAHPALVVKELRAVVRTEWEAQVDHLGVIHRGPYEALGTAELVRDLVMDEFERSAPRHTRTVRYAIGALLLVTKPARDLSKILEAQVNAARSEDAGVLAEWLRGWSHFAPEQTATWLLALAQSDRQRFLELVEALASLLEQDFDGHRPIAPVDWSATALEMWIRTLHIAVRPEDDIERAGTGVYSPGARDHAQDFRNRCVSLLARNPTREAFEALRRIREVPEMRPYAETVDRLITAQLTVASEHLATTWTEDDILAVERGDERTPRNNAELLALITRHLRKVAQLLENDDFSYAELFDEDEAEREVQCWVASSLKLVSGGLYNVERESAAQDAKLMDISIAVPGVGRIPIEIKPLDARRYRYPQLKGFIAEQLVGRYMRPASVDRGIFLLVPLKVRSWRDGERTMSFDDLLARLQMDADRIGAAAYKEVRVMGINVAAARASRVAVRRKDKKAVRSVKKTSAARPAQTKAAGVANATMARARKARMVQPAKAAGSAPVKKRAPKTPPKGGQGGVVPTPTKARTRRSGR